MPWETWNSTSILQRSLWTIGVLRAPTTDVGATASAGGMGKEPGDVLVDPGMTSLTLLGDPMGGNPCMRIDPPPSLRKAVDPVVTTDDERSRMSMADDEELDEELEDDEELDDDEELEELDDE